ncbi:hypothetical protein SODALDRAFT_335544 [Sodiomyces alkalinus F11]|uniref:Uncharacterized protein n=1 Tax=Sodiomyces alkalinus (strain CBS 110278 / VKM F-3762 / F11) TaxID=1314773 RepID=A0A3N2PPL5_SODAK|nr:hypothetical protein SODALDRAFT_335544 [Sodiomyces alkalinus F11]ROT36445.1 hypothetical protein SODALDRAFT_335544 [Sodiomyces alkalinus F11]
MGSLDFIEDLRHSGADITEVRSMSFRQITSQQPGESYDRFLAKWEAFVNRCDGAGTLSDCDRIRMVLGRVLPEIRRGIPSEKVPEKYEDLHPMIREVEAKEKELTDSLRAMEAAHLIFKTPCFQKRGQSYDDFADEWDARIDLMPDALPDPWRIWMVLSHVLPEIYDRIVRQGVPKKYTDLRPMARYAEASARGLSRSRPEAEAASPHQTTRQDNDDASRKRRRGESSSENWHRGKKRKSGGRGGA